jgi:flagellar motor switch protein FliN/FliY
MDKTSADTRNDRTSARADDPRGPAEHTPELLSAGAPRADARAPFDRLDMFLDVGLNVRVELGRSIISIQRAMQITEGSVIELDKVAGDPLDILVNGRVVARGEAVVIGDRLGVRILEVIPAERVARSSR